MLSQVRENNEACWSHFSNDPIKVIFFHFIVGQNGKKIKNDSVIAVDVILLSHLVPYSNKQTLLYLQKITLAKSLFLCYLHSMKEMYNGFFFG